MSVITALPIPRTQPAAQESKNADRLAAFALATVMIGAFMSLLDTTIVNVALPSIQHGLHASNDELEWVVSGYALAFGLALIPAGRLGDAIGRKPVYLAGLVLFLLASLGAGLARDPAELVLARVVQGLGAGAYYTQINATIVDTFAGSKRSKAFGVLAAIIGLSTAMGPLAGGLLISAAGAQSGWRLIFIVNLAIGIVAIPASVKFLPPAVRHPRQSSDLAGLCLLAAGLILVLLPLIEGETLGWPTWTYLCFGGAIPVFVGLWFRERRVEREGHTALVPPRVVRRPSFAVGAVFALLYFASFTSIFFSIAVTWQEGFGHSALASGLVVSPFAVGAVITSRKSHVIARRLGRRILVLGCVLVAAGLTSIFAVFHATSDPSGWLLVGPLLLTGLGHGLIVAPNIDLVLKSVPIADTGAASGVLNTAQRVGSALGIAIVGTVLFGTLHPLSQTHGAIQAAFGSSLEDALLVNIGLIIVTLVLAFAKPSAQLAAPTGQLVGDATLTASPSDLVETVADAS